MPKYQNKMRSADPKCKGVDFGKGGRAKECYHNFGGDGKSYGNHHSFDAYTPTLCGMLT